MQFGRTARAGKEAGAKRKSEILTRQFDIVSGGLSLGSVLYLLSKKKRSGIADVGRYPYFSSLGKEDTDGARDMAIEIYSKAKKFGIIK